MSPGGANGSRTTYVAKDTCFTWVTIFYRLISKQKVEDRTFQARLPISPQLQKHGLLHAAFSHLIGILNSEGMSCSLSRSSSVGIRLTTGGEEWG